MVQRFDTAMVERTTAALKLWFFTTHVTVSVMHTIPGVLTCCNHTEHAPYVVLEHSRVSDQLQVPVAVGGGRRRGGRSLCLLLS